MLPACKQNVDSASLTRKEQGILDNNITSRMESSANGITYSGTIVSFVLFVILVAVVHIGRQVCGEYMFP